MSLLRVRRERKESGPGRSKRPPSPIRLVLLLLLVVGLIWYLGQLF